jgi:hypothetical protein
MIASFRAFNKTVNISPSFWTYPNSHSVCLPLAHFARTSPRLHSCPRPDFGVAASRATSVLSLDRPGHTEAAPATHPEREATFSTAPSDRLLKLALHAFLRGPLLPLTRSNPHRLHLVATFTRPTTPTLTPHTTLTFPKNHLCSKTMATLGAQRKHKVTVVGSGNW